MSAEFFVEFKDKNWFLLNAHKLKKRVELLGTFRKKNNTEFWLKNKDEKDKNEQWEYDVRIFFGEDSIFLEISSHPLSIEKDLLCFLDFIRHETEINIHDEDGEKSNW